MARWYLPDGNPIFWHALRGYPRGRGWHILVAGCAIYSFAQGVLLMPPRMQGAMGTIKLDIFEASFQMNHVLLMVTWLASVLLCISLPVDAVQRLRRQYQYEEIAMTRLTVRQVILGTWASWCAMLFLAMAATLPVVGAIAMYWMIDADPLLVLVYLPASVMHLCAGTCAGLLYRSRVRAIVVALGFVIICVIVSNIVSWMLAHGQLGFMGSFSQLGILGSILMNSVSCMLICYVTLKAKKNLLFDADEARWYVLPRSASTPAAATAGRDSGELP